MPPPKPQLRRPVWPPHCHWPDRCPSEPRIQAVEPKPQVFYRIKIGGVRRPIRDDYTMGLESFGDFSYLMNGGIVLHVCKTRFSNSKNIFFQKLKICDRGVPLTLRIWVLCHSNQIWSSRTPNTSPNHDDVLPLFVRLNHLFVPLFMRHAKDLFYFLSSTPLHRTFITSDVLLPLVKDPVFPQLTPCQSLDGYLGSQQGPFFGQPVS